MSAPASGKAAATLELKQIKSGIGFEVDQKRTLKALGLGRIGQVRTLPDNPQVRGMIGKVQHLVEVIEDQTPDGRA